MISDPSTRAIDALRRIVRALLMSTHDLEQQTGITSAQRFVLEQLADGPLASVNALAARTHTRQATVSVVLSRLESRGLVRRDRDPRDRRRAMVTLTPSGRRLLRRSEVPVQAHLISALASMPHREVRTLAQALERWVAAARLGTTPARLFLEPDAPSRSTRRTDA
jgi:DNA-binding MarR family transcriptional regulator